MKRIIVMMTICVGLLAGCGNPFMHLATSGGLFPKKDYHYPEVPELKPLPSAVYATIKDNVNQFENFKGSQLSASEKQSKIEGIENWLMNMGNRQHAVQMAGVWRKATYHEANIEDLFDKTNYEVINPFIVTNLRVRAERPATALVYKIDTDGKQQAEQLAKDIAGDLSGKAMPKSKDWGWLSKEESLERKKSRHKRKLEEVDWRYKYEERIKRNARQALDNIEKQEDNGDFDFVQTHYMFRKEKVTEENWTTPPKVTKISVWFSYQKENLLVMIMRS